MQQLQKDELVIVSPVILKRTLTRFELIFSKILVLNNTFERSNLLVILNFIIFLSQKMI